MIQRIVCFICLFQSLWAHAISRDVFFTEHLDDLTRASGMRSFQVVSPSDALGSETLKTDPTKPSMAAHLDQVGKGRASSQDFKGVIQYNPFSQKWNLKDEFGVLQAQARITDASDLKKLGKSAIYVIISCEDHLGNFLGEKQLVSSSVLSKVLKTTQARRLDSALDNSIVVEHSEAVKKVFFSNTAGEKLVALTQEKAARAWKLEFLKTTSSVQDEPFTFFALFLSVWMSTREESAPIGWTVFHRIQSFFWPTMATFLGGLSVSFAEDLKKTTKDHARSMQVLQNELNQMRQEGTPDRGESQAQSVNSDLQSLSSDSSKDASNSGIVPKNALSADVTDEQRSTLPHLGDAFDDHSLEPQVWQRSAQELYHNQLSLRLQSKVEETAQMIRIFREEQYAFALQRADDYQREVGRLQDDLKKLQCKYIDEFTDFSEKIREQAILIEALEAKLSTLERVNEMLRQGALSLKETTASQIAINQKVDENLDKCHLLVQQLAVTDQNLLSQFNTFTSRLHSAQQTTEGPLSARHSEAQIVGQVNSSSQLGSPSELLAPFDEKVRNFAVLIFSKQSDSILAQLPKELSSVWMFAYADVWSVLREQAQLGAMNPITFSQSVDRANLSFSTLSAVHWSSGHFTSNMVKPALREILALLGHLKSELLSQKDFDQIFPRNEQLMYEADFRAYQTCIFRLKFYYLALLQLARVGTKLDCSQTGTLLLPIATFLEKYPIPLMPFEPMIMRFSK